MEKGVPCGFRLSAQQRVQHIQPRDIRDSKGRAEPSLSLIHISNRPAILDANSICPFSRRGSDSKYRSSVLIALSPFHGCEECPLIPFAFTLHPPSSGSNDILSLSAKASRHCSNTPCASSPPRTSADANAGTTFTLVPPPTSTRISPSSSFVFSQRSVT